MNKIRKSRSRNGQWWIQTWSGLMILFVLPVIASIFFFPAIQFWVRSTPTNAQLPSASTVQATKAVTRFPVEKQKRLPESILKIAEVSEAEPGVSQTGSVPPSEFSHAIQHLHRALEARPELKAKDVLDAANRMHLTADPAPCPFEWIHDEGAVVLSDKAEGKISLMKTLNRCAEAIEQVTPRER